MGHKEGWFREGKGCRAFFEHFSYITKRQRSGEETTMYYEGINDACCAVLLHCNLEIDNFLDVEFIAENRRNICL